MFWNRRTKEDKSKWCFASTRKHLRYEYNNVTIVGIINLTIRIKAQRKSRNVNCKGNVSSQLKRWGLNGIFGYSFLLHVVSNSSYMNNCTVKATFTSQYRKPSEFTINIFILGGITHFKLKASRAQWSKIHTCLPDVTKLWAYQKPWSRGLHICFVFGRSWVHISVRRLTILRLLVVFISPSRRIPGKVPQVRPRPPPSMSFTIN
jgi:hypothetical protein